jgi:hypothetical protein
MMLIDFQAKISVLASFDSLFLLLLVSLVQFEKNSDVHGARNK